MIFSEKSKDASLWTGNYHGMETLGWGEAMIEYKGYVGIVQYDADLDTFHGTVVNTQDVISFYGSSVEELHAEMRQSIEAYLDFCEEQGRPPEKPYSGSLTVRTSPELHRKIAMAAARRRQSMNQFVQMALERAVGE